MLLLPLHAETCLDLVEYLVHTLGRGRLPLALPGQPAGAQQRRPCRRRSSIQACLQPSMQRAERTEAADAAHRLLNGSQAGRGGAGWPACQLAQSGRCGAGWLGGGTRLLQRWQLLHPLHSQLA